MTMQRRNMLEHVTSCYLISNGRPSKNAGIALIFCFCLHMLRIDEKKEFVNQFDQCERKGALFTLALESSQNFSLCKLSLCLGFAQKICNTYAKAPRKC